MLASDNYAAELQILLAANARRARLDMGISQNALARLSGLPQPTLSEIEAGCGNRTLRTLSRLAESLGLSLALLLTERSAS